MSLLMALLYIVILGACGFLTATVILRLKDPYAVIGMTFVFGTTVFLLLSNAFAYVLPIRSAFFVTFGMITGFTFVCVLRFFRKKDSRWSMEPSDRRGMWFLLVLSAICAFVNSRFVGSDPWSWQHFPLAATIVSGNFPVMNPIDPQTLLAYHYAPAFLAAGFQILTGSSLIAGFFLQPIIGAAGILFFTAALVRSQKGSARVAVIAAVLALAGTGLAWLKGAEILAIVQHGALSGVGNLIGSSFTTSPLIFLGHRSTATGFPLLYGCLWVIALMFDQKDFVKRCILAVIGFIFALGLTLTMEMAFVTLSFSSAIVALVMLASSTTRTSGIRLIQFGCLALIPALLVGFFHGGVLSGLGSGGDHSFAWHPAFRITYDTYGNTVVPWSIRFLRDFGLPLFLSPFAVAFAWKRRITQPAWLPIVAIGIVHFLLPFFLEYKLIEGEMRRAFYVFTSTFALMAGIVIDEYLLRRRSTWLRVVGVALITSMVLSSVIYLVMRAVIPTGRMEPTPLFASMPTITHEQEEMYAWVRENTTLKDFFYVRNLTEDFEKLPDETAQMRDRILFTTYTGRFTVGPIIFWSYKKEWLEKVLEAETTCDVSVMKSLSVRYLLVETSDREAWFKRLCRPNDWKVRYEGDSGALPRIYELIKPV